MDLFAHAEKANRERSLPLAARMRPRTLSEFVGQTHILGPGKLLRRLIDAKRVQSVLFYGPPGTGKTTLAHLLANETGGKFRQINAVTSGIKELREAIQWAKDEVSSGAERPILFIDEIHRFNRTQQDALLPDVEDGIVALVGATTSNPFFSVNGALLSRSQLFELKALTEAEIVRLLEHAIEDKSRGLGMYQISADQNALSYCATMSEGDARRALGAIELAVLSSSQSPIVLDVTLVRDSMQKKVLQFDASGDQHYDMASALIKSIRGSDVDAALYWLARSLECGEEVRFLCRRLVILASEDIGNADPHALPLAVAAMQACEFVGLPECQLTLSQIVIYLSLAPKSNSATTAIGQAISDVREGTVIPVPVHLRDGHYQGAKSLGHGMGYEYAHDSEQGIAAQDYLGVEREYYHPVSRGFESELAQRWAEIKGRLKNR
ncbi:MAG: replication-associated recombination protein A [Pirellula sp.]